MSYNDDKRRKPHPQGAGRRVYSDAAGGAPRVGRIAPNVPKAQRVTAEREDTGTSSDLATATKLPARPPSSKGKAFGEQTNIGEREFYRGNRARKGNIPSHANQNSTLHSPLYTFREDTSPLHRGSAYRAPTGPQAPIEAEDGHILAGRNPIREALRAGRPVEKLLVASGDLSGAAQEIVRMAREAGAVVQRVERSRLDQIYPAHQGMLAYVAAVPYVELEDILAAAREKGEEPFLILLDGITDPHNLGAIVRTAECAGAHGVVIPERRAAGLTPAAAKAAAGALNHMPIARVKNLNRAIEALRDSGVWVVGTAMDGEDALTADLTGPIALVIGSEGEGVSRLALEKCDRTVCLPMKGRIESLNASVAAGILMYEIVRARAK